MGWRVRYAGGGLWAGRWGHGWVGGVMGGVRCCDVSCQVRMTLWSLTLWTFQSRGAEDRLRRVGEPWLHLRDPRCPGPVDTLARRVAQGVRAGCLRACGNRTYSADRPGTQRCAPRSRSWPAARGTDRGGRQSSWGSCVRRVAWATAGRDAPWYRGHQNRGDRQQQSSQGQHARAGVVQSGCLGKQQVLVGDLNPRRPVWSDVRQLEAPAR